MGLLEISDILTFGGIGFGIYYFVYGAGSAVTAFTDTVKYPVMESMGGGKKQHKVNDDGSTVNVEMLPTGEFCIATTAKPDSGGKNSMGDTKYMYYDKAGISLTVEQWSVLTNSRPPSDLPGQLVDGRTMQSTSSSNLLSSTMKSNNINPYNPTYQPVASLLRPAQTGGGWVGRVISVLPPFVHPGPFTTIPANNSSPGFPTMPGFSSYPVQTGFIVKPYWTIPNPVFGF